MKQIMILFAVSGKGSCV